MNDIKPIQAFTLLDSHTMNCDGKVPVSRFIAERGPPADLFKYVWSLRGRQALKG